MNRRCFISGAAAVVASSPAAAAVVRADDDTEGDGKRLKLSCCAYSYRKYMTGDKPSMTMEQFIDQCAKWELDGVELTHYYFAKPTTRTYLHKLKRQAFLLGLEISGTTARNDFCIEDKADLEKQFEEIKQCLAWSVELGAPVMRIFGGVIPKGVSREEALARVVEHLGKAADLAKAEGVVLGLENHGSMPDSAEDLFEIIRQVGSDWVGINLDTGNFRTADPYYDIQLAAPHAVNCQVKTDTFDQSGKKVPADLKRMIEPLKKCSYRGHVALEYEGAEEPADAVPRYLKELRKLMS